MTTKHSLAFPAIGAGKEFYKGLTKREYFAAMAMQGILSSRELQIVLSLDKCSFTEFAVKQADDLINELNKPQQ